MEKPSLWLWKTATNLGLKYLRRQKLEQAWLVSREHWLDGKKIARQLNISEHTVKNQLSAALKSIQQHLIKNGISLITVITITFHNWLYFFL
jgi:DNA-directed RNA polymerase specialized sigma24 family protein